MDFLIARDDLHSCRFDDEPPPQPADGQALLRVERFGLTSNNITYATFGEAMSYWNFFPAPDGWGRMPVWGFAQVSDSRVDELPTGTRVYGYLPPSSELIVQPDEDRARRASSTPAPTAPSCRRPTTATRASTPTRSTTPAPRPSRCCCARCSSPRI